VESPQNPLQEVEGAFASSSSAFLEKKVQTKKQPDIQRGGKFEVNDHVPFKKPIFESLITKRKTTSWRRGMREVGNRFRQEKTYSVSGSLRKSGKRRMFSGGHRQET